MKTIIAGSRGIEDYEIVKKAIEESGFTPTEVVSGNARGVDRLGEQWAQENNVPIKIFKAQWDLLGRSAGFIRNEEMVRYADALIAVWDNHSRGTKYTIGLAKRKKIPVFILTVERD